MNDGETFDLVHFLPYSMTMAADALSLEFQQIYKGRFGMLRTEWRVLFHLGRYGPMTAKDICQRARVHKTKVSRAVTALEIKRYLSRQEVETDRRHSLLQLTRQGDAVFSELYQEARAFDARVRQSMTRKEAETLHKLVNRIAGLDHSNSPDMTPKRTG